MQLASRLSLYLLSFFYFEGGIWKGEIICPAKILIYIFFLFNLPPWSEKRFQKGHKKRRFQTASVAIQSSRSVYLSPIRYTEVRDGIFVLLLLLYIT